MDGSVYSNLFEGVLKWLLFLAIMFIVLLPLAIWKLIDITIWIIHHVYILWTILNIY